MTSPIRHPARTSGPQPARTRAERLEQSRAARLDNPEIDELAAQLQALMLTGKGNARFKVYDAWNKALIGWNLPADVTETLRMQLIGEAINSATSVLELRELSGEHSWDHVIMHLERLANEDIRKHPYQEELWRAAGPGARAAIRLAATQSIRAMIHGTPHGRPGPMIYPDLGRRAELELRKEAMNGSDSPARLQGPCAAPDAAQPFHPDAAARTSPTIGLPRHAAALGLSPLEISSLSGDADGAARRLRVTQPRGRQAERRLQRALDRLGPTTETGPIATWRREWSGLVERLDRASWKLPPADRPRLNSLCARMQQRGVRATWQATQAASSSAGTPLERAQRLAWDDLILLLTGDHSGLGPERWVHAGSRSRQ